MIEAFEHVMPKTGKLQKLQTDLGREFLNWPFQTYLKQHRIKHFRSQILAQKQPLLNNLYALWKKNHGVILPRPTAENR